MRLDLTRRRTPPVAVLTSLLLGLPGTAMAYGEPVSEGLPSHRERILHVLTNQVRQAPHDWPGWDTTTSAGHARNPLAFDPGLAEAARFHADDMAANSFFDHTSSDGTSFQARLQRYFQGPAGENIYTAFGDIRVTAGVTGWLNSPPHRTNMLEESWNRLGAGDALTGGAVLLVQNFGTASGDAPPIPAAAPWPQPGGSVRLIANYFDPEGHPPRAAEAMVDGTSVVLERIAGSAGNETLAAEVSAPDDCASVYFLVQTDQGDQVTYPTAGALRFGEGCPSEYSEGRAGPEDGRPVIDANDPSGGCRCVAPPRRGPVALALLALVGLVSGRARRRTPRGPLTGPDHPR